MLYAQQRLETPAPAKDKIKPTQNIPIMKSILSALTLAIVALSISSCASKPAAPAPVDTGIHATK